MAIRPLDISHTPHVQLQTLTAPPIKLLLDGLLHCGG